MSSVLHRHPCLYFATRAELVAAERQLTILEGGVGQAIAGGEHRTAVDVGVVGGIFAEPFADGTSGHHVVIIERLLTGGLGERGGEFAAWTGIAEEDVADGVAPLTAAKPYVEDGGDVLLLPFHHHGTAGEIDHHNGLASCLQCLQQALLRLRKAYVGTAGTFPCHLLRLANGGNDDICIGNRLERLIEQLCLRTRVTDISAEDFPVGFYLLVLMDVASLCIDHLGLLSQGAAHALQEGGELIRVGVCCRCPVATHILWGMCHGTYQIVVFQQDETLCRNLTGKCARGIGVENVFLLLGGRVAIAVGVFKET